MLDNSPISNLIVYQGDCTDTVSFKHYAGALNSVLNILVL